MSRSAAVARQSRISYGGGGGVKLTPPPVKIGLMTILMVRSESLRLRSRKKHLPHDNNLMTILMVRSDSLRLRNRTKHLPHDNDDHPHGEVRQSEA